MFFYEIELILMIFLVSTVKFLSYKGGLNIDKDMRVQEIVSIE
jgi:hypothetical protein